ncbi:lasso RiPP family leader peptide-containing protein [Streptomyces sp. NPDC059616]|uniref:lasso RiPP family leader peptide-containing protein n=1 Tax=Streptomyces sp. NPDC059616 TaxID=3346886 RepID=UPI0036ABF226
MYEPPMLIELGDFAALTRGFDIGNQSDVHGYCLAPEEPGHERSPADLVRGPSGHRSRVRDGRGVGHGRVPCPAPPQRASPDPRRLAGRRVGHRPGAS